MDATRLTLLLGILSVAFLCGFWFGPGGVLALRRRAGGELQVDLRFFYTPGTLYRLLDLYGEDGRRSFRNLLLADMIFPAVYAATLYSLGGLIASTHPAHVLLASVGRCTGIAAALFDYGENLSLLYVMRNLKSPPDGIADLAGICTMLKVVAFAVSAAAFATALLAASQG
jgi:hypothetical protein